MKFYNKIMYILICLMLNGPLVAQNAFEIQCYKSPDYNTSGQHFRLPKEINEDTGKVVCSVTIHPIQENADQGLGAALVLSNDPLSLNKRDNNITWGRIEFYKGISFHGGVKDVDSKGSEVNSWKRISNDNPVQVEIAYQSETRNLVISFSASGSVQKTFTFDMTGKKFQWHYLSVCSMKMSGAENIHGKCTVTDMSINGGEIDKSELFELDASRLALSSPETENKLVRYLENNVYNKLPFKGSPVFDTFDWRNFPHSNWSYALFDIDKVDGQPFDESLLVTCIKKPKTFHTVQISSRRNTMPVKKGDMIFMQLTARCLKSSDESGEGYIAASAVIDGVSWKSITSLAGYVPGDWKTLYGWGVAKENSAPGTVRLHLHLSHRQQTLELGGIVMLNLGQNVDESKMPHEVITYNGRSSDASWRTEASKMIEKYRKGDVNISIKDIQGNPIPGVSISVQMLRHEYGFGCYVDDHPLLYQNDDGENFRNWFKKLFNKAVVPVFWGPGTFDEGWGWENPKSKQNYISSIKWCVDNNIPTQGHVLVYPSFYYAPPDVKNLKDKPELLRERINGHVEDVLGTLSGMLDEIQVVNEYYGSTDFSNVLGRNEVVSWFEMSHAKAPGLRLYLNDNSILSGGGGHTECRDFYKKTLDTLIANHAPVGGIGFQAHLGGTLTGPQKIWDVLDEFSEYHLPIMATEFTVDTQDEKLQAEYTRDFYTAFFAHPSTDGIINWGFWAGKHYRPVCAFFAKDWKMKPNGEAYMDLVFNKWWTHTGGTTDKNGAYQFRGFYGDYKIVLQYKSKEYEFEAKLLREKSRSCTWDLVIH